MSCISFGGMRVDRVVAQEVLERVQPLGVGPRLRSSIIREQKRKSRQKSANSKKLYCFSFPEKG
jgi:hypothetical protein